MNENEAPPQRDRKTSAIVVLGAIFGLLVGLIIGFIVAAGLSDAPSAGPSTTEANSGTAPQGTASLVTTQPPVTTIPGQPADPNAVTTDASITDLISELSGEPAVLVGAGDISDCGNDGDIITAN